jgi:hypothetical protein
LTHGEDVVTRDEALASWRRAQLGEVIWVDAGDAPGAVTAPASDLAAGAVDAAVVVPLVHDGRPALALHYGRRELALRLAASRDVWVTIATPAVARGATPVAMRVAFDLAEDPEGDGFHASSMLDQELAKHPPSRRRLEHLVARREHWWYTGRMLLTARAVTEARRLEDGDAVVGGLREGELEVAAAHLPEAPHRPDGEVTVRTALRDGPAVVLSHGGDVPDLEVPWHHRWRGTLAGDRLRIDEDHGYDAQARRPSLWQRLRTERALERACRDGMRAADDARSRRG